MNERCIILIGPMGVGKTTAAKALALRFGLAYIDFDELRWDYYKRMPGYSPQGEGDFFTYVKPFEAALVETLLAEHVDGVFDFGAGHSVYDDPVLFNRVKTALDPYPNVVYMRYSDDAAESGQVLLTRNNLTEAETAMYASMNDKFIQSPCNSLLAKHTVDTKGLDSDQVIDAIIAGLVQ